jgi:hypothetical protein
VYIHSDDELASTYDTLFLPVLNAFTQPGMEEISVTLDCVGASTSQYMQCLRVMFGAGHITWNIYKDAS